MLASLIAIATEVISEYGTLGIFVLGIIEEIFLPVPSSFTLMAAGFFMLKPEMSFIVLLEKALFMIALPGALGLAIGSLFFYLIGIKGGKPLILRFGKFVGLSWEKIEKMEERFKHSKSDEFSLFFLRAFPIVPNIAISAMCGVIQYPAKKFFLIAFLGNIVRGLIMAFFGFATGEAYNKYAESISRVEHLLFGGLILILLTYFLYKKRKQSVLLVQKEKA